MVDLPAPVGPDERHRLAGLDVEVDVAQDGDRRVVPERHVDELDVALERWQRRRVRRLLDRRVRRQQVVELDDRGLALLVQVVLLDELLDRLEERVQVQDERGQLADRERAVLDHRAADQQEHRLAHDPDELGGRAEAGHDPGRLVVAVAVLAHDVAVVEHVVALAVEAGHDPDALEALGDVGQDRRDPVADPHVAGVRGDRNHSDRARAAAARARTA